MRKIEIEYEILYNKYIKECKTIENIALELKVSSKIISNSLRNFGIKTKGMRYVRAENMQDFTGKTFGYLIAKERQTNDLNRRCWLCECTCGHELCKKTKLVRVDHLISKSTTSCGMATRTSYKDIRGGVLYAIERRAKKKNIEFNLTIEYIWDLFLKQNRKCALSGVELKFECGNKKFDTTASLDRIDSSKGYTINNVQWVHKNLNFMKYSLKEEDFNKWIELIYKHKNHPISEVVDYEI